MVREERCGKKIIDTAYKVIKKYSKERVFSLGQSPAWVVKVAELLAKKKGSNQMFRGIAFSGRYVHERHGPNIGGVGSGGYERRCRVYYMDNPREYEGQYRAYLASIGMSPREIVEKAASGVKTVLIEYVQTGASLASFLFTLYRWALDEGCSIDEGLQVVVLRKDFCKLGGITLGEYSKYIQFDRLAVEDSMIVPLANGLDKGEESDRLVARYASDAWNHLPTELENQGVREKIASIFAQELSDGSYENEVEVQKPTRVEGFFHEEKGEGFNEISSKQAQNGCLPGVMGCQII